MLQNRDEFKNDTSAPMYVALKTGATPSEVRKLVALQKLMLNRNQFTVECSKLVAN